MKTMTAKEAKINFEALIDGVQIEPIMIIKENRAVGVFVSMQDIEDSILGEMALKADKEGYFSVDESDAVLNQFRGK
jgi:hypothetical protein